VILASWRGRVDELEGQMFVALLLFLYNWNAALSVGNLGSGFLDSAGEKSTFKVRSIEIWLNVVSRGKV
jgi:hypothetical protein